jgi:ABC-2 type transport system ATP-binding protein
LNPLIALQNITKDYGKFRALDDVTLEIHNGVVGLLGPNGAGKSTLIKMLMGMVSVQRGSGTVFDYTIGKDDLEIRRRIGYMPEDDCYVSGLTGVEMVQFTARLSGIPPLEALRRAHEILDFSGTEQERYRQVETYSTGMRQKLKFAQAIVHDPDLLIFDEPTAGLDPNEREIMLRRIQSLHRDSGKAILISTHILPDVQTICDHVVILVGGRVRLTESMSVLSAPSEPTVQVRVFGDAAPLIRVAATHGCQARQNYDGSVTIEGLDPQDVERVWQWSSEANVDLQALKPARNSIEQIFIDAVRGDITEDTTLGRK